MKSAHLTAGTFALAAIALVGCVPDQEFAKESSSEEAAAAYEHPPVGVLVSLDHRITIHTGTDGPLYSVTGPEGKQLAKEISREELQASFPDLDVSEIWAEVSSVPRPIETTVKTGGFAPIPPRQ